MNENDRRLEAEAEAAAQRRQPWLESALRQYPAHEVLEDLCQELHVAETYRTREVPANMQKSVTSALALDRALRAALGDIAVDSLLAHWRAKAEGDDDEPAAGERPPASP